MKNQFKVFWYVFYISLLLINENFVQWLLAMFVGKYNLIDGFNDAYEYFSILGYLFFTGFRAIPYALLATLVKLGIKYNKDHYLGVAWGGLVGILSMVIWLSWKSMHAYYTDAHVSSTIAIDFLFIPIYAIPTGIVGSLIGYGLLKKINDIKKT